MSQDYYKNPGRIYITDANAQQLVWSARAAQIQNVYSYTDTIDKFLSAVVTDYDRPTQTICDCLELSLSNGFYAEAGANNIVFAINNSKLSNLAQNTSIWNLNIGSKILAKDFKEFQNINIAEGLERLPSTAYYSSNSTSLVIDKDQSYSSYLECLLDLKGIQRWTHLNQAQAMYLFAGKQNFQLYIGDPKRGKCRGLAAFMQPFSTAFAKSLNPLYLRSFGRWLQSSTMRSTSQRRLGVSRYATWYYCEFDLLAFKRWRELLSIYHLN